MRCFIALDISPEARRTVARLQSALARFEEALRMVRPGSTHLTLKFLGNVPDERVAAVAEALSVAARAVEPFDFYVTGGGCFPPRGTPRVVWAGVRETTGRLATLQRRIEEAIEPLGFPREARPFHPHVTVARVRDGRGVGGLRQVVEQTDLPEVRCHAREVLLFESRLRPGGADYHVVARAWLKGSR